VKFFLLNLLFLLIFTSCDKSISPEPELPPITTEGKNTFGCLVNGEVWLPKNSIVKSGKGLSANFYPDDINVFTIGADRFDEFLNITVTDCCDDGSYFLINDSEMNSSATYINSELDHCYYETDSVKTGNYGEIEIIHFEPRKFIVAGTFEFTVVTEDCDTIRVTEGRFDVNYNAI